MKTPNVMAAVRKMLNCEGISNEEIYYAIASDFPRENPRWLRNMIANYRCQIRRREKQKAAIAR